MQRAAAQHPAGQRPPQLTQKSAADIAPHVFARDDHNTQRTIGRSVDGAASALTEIAAVCPMQLIRARDRVLPVRGIDSHW